MFARRRMVANYLQPEPAGTSEEMAPRPMKAVVPGLVIGVLVMAGFGVYGVIKPGTPAKWNDKGSLIVGRDSASRYVYLKDDQGRGELHPVLNIASGRLLLDPGKFKVNMVPEKTINNVPHGAPLGIPGAPDRLPSAKEVKKPTTWTVCEQQPPVPGTAGRDQKAEPQRSVFIGKPPASGNLQSGEVLYVKAWVNPNTSNTTPANKTDPKTDPKNDPKNDPKTDPKNAPQADPKSETGASYLVQNGRKYLVSTPVLSSLGVSQVSPQPVSDAWLGTLGNGGEISFKAFEPERFGQPAPNLPAELGKIGTVLKPSGEESAQRYVVTAQGIEPVSPLMAVMLLNHPRVKELYNGKEAAPQAISMGQYGDKVVQGKLYKDDLGWPLLPPVPVNQVGAEPRTVVCNTFDGRFNGDTPSTVQSASTQLPGELVASMGGVFVPPGKGALYKEEAKPGAGGTVYLLTDSGLRYVIPNESLDPAQPAPQLGPDGESDAQARLGYQGVRPQTVPREWSELVQRGPSLSALAAKKPQGS
jgi:hypothetical protein